MLQGTLQALPGADRVTDKLVARLGAGRVWQIQQLSEHIYRVLLNDGAVFIATVDEVGEVHVREVEAVW